MFKMMRIILLLYISNLVIYFFQLSPFVLRTNNVDNESIYSGFCVDILNQLALKFKFKLVLIYVRICYVTNSIV